HTGIDRHGLPVGEVPERVNLYRVHQHRASILRGPIALVGQPTAPHLTDNRRPQPYGSGLIRQYARGH
ncbi:hypothetical protein, partial [Streptomyces sp. DSM 41033]|uniref:hypothetical protein n=1 Tax=Streptomyces sp. DSM 41033 TaxID=3448655 RepID=UPI00403FEA10